MPKQSGRGYAGSGASIFVTWNGVKDSANVVVNPAANDNGVYIETTSSGWSQNNTSMYDLSA
jgi:hypothetical protein